MGLFTTITPSEKDSKFYPNFPSDMDDWSCIQWKSYYDNLKAAYGKTKALEIFQIDISRVGFFADVNNCKYDCSFINYFKGEGLTGGNLISQTYCVGSGIADTAGTLVGNVGDVVATATNAKLLITVAIVGGIFWYNNKKK